MSEFLPSPQQAAFYDWIDRESGSCVLEAVAGAGKTTTLIEGLRRMPGEKFLGAYNKQIAEEIKSKAGAVPGLTVSTMHAAGYKYLRRAFPNVQLNEAKCRDLARAGGVPREIEGLVLRLVSYGKQAGLGAIGPRIEDHDEWAGLVDHFNIDAYDERTGKDRTEEIIQCAQYVLLASNAAVHTVIDFDDMVYAPLEKNVKFWGHDWVLIDEAQDTNATRRELSLRLLRPGGRLVAVGDRHQAIYGFTGADSDALDIIARRVNAVRLPLTTTYRCPRAVVAHAQQYVGHIQAHESAPEGQVQRLKESALHAHVRPGDAVLCRFNAPLLGYAYDLIGRGVPAKVEGRDIAEGIKQLARRLRGGVSWDAMHVQLDEYTEREAAKFRGKEQEARAVAVEDKAQCLRVVMNRCAAAQPDPTRSVIELCCAEVDTIFTEGVNGNVVLLSSIHKSKGREWDRVYWIQTGPSPWARKEWEQGQEINLCYVAATRAKSILTLVMKGE